MLQKKAALLAAGTFALGLVVGKSWNTHSAIAVDDVQNVSRRTTLPANHPAVGERGLDDAVRATLQRRGAAGTGDLLAQADELRRARQFQAATEVYRRVVASGGMTADAWADYADALASASSTLQGEPARALDAALALDARHPKALWLKASLEHEERRYAEAVKTWQTLLAVVPTGSSDADIIRANIAEATRLASSRS